MIRAFFLALPVTAVFALPAAAEVISVSETGFEMSHKVIVEADADTAWAALFEPAQWWNPDHSWSGDAANFSMDKYTGGCLCEVWEHGDVEHLFVASIIEGQSLTLRGALGPLQAHGVDGSMVWTFEEGEDDGLLDITVTYRVGGYLPEGMDYWAGPVDGVITEQADRLAALLNTGSPGTE